MYMKFQRIYSPFLFLLEFNNHVKTNNFFLFFLVDVFRKDINFLSTHSSQKKDALYFGRLLKIKSFV